MKTCLIIAGGSFSEPPVPIEYDYCIACDSGYSHAQRLGINPNLIIGDFDSYEGNPVEIPDDIEIIRFPIEKDDTDLMLAIKHADAIGYNHIIIICALGGRLDHTLSNIQAMAYAASKGISAEIISEDEHLRTFCGGTISLPKRVGFSLSLFSLSDKCTNVSINGAKYNISGAEFTNTFPLGLGNSWVYDEVIVSMASGIMLIAESKLPAN